MKEVILVVIFIWAVVAIVFLLIGGGRPKVKEQ